MSTILCQLLSGGIGEQPSKRNPSSKVRENLKYGIETQTEECEEF